MADPKGLKGLMAGGKTLVMPGAFSALTARLAEEAGFKALYVSGAGLANSVAALPDIGLLTMTEVAREASYIINAVDLPCLVDADTGFGEAANVGRTVKELERAGAGGMQMEDQQMPKRCGHLSGKTLVPPAAMCEKIAAAVEARKDQEFLIVARTDARATEGMAGAVERAGMYVEAGADCVFPEALETKEEFALFKKELKAPLLANMTEFGKTPYISVREFEAIGVDIVIFPLTAMRVMLKAVKGALERLKADGTQEGFINDMLTREELYRLLGYEGYEAADKRIAGRFKKGGGDA